MSYSIAVEDDVKTEYPGLSVLLQTHLPAKEWRPSGWTIMRRYFFLCVHVHNVSKPVSQQTCMVFLLPSSLSPGRIGLIDYCWIKKSPHPLGMSSWSSSWSQWCSLLTWWWSSRSCVHIIQHFILWNSSKMYTLMKCLPLHGPSSLESLHPGSPYFPGLPPPLPGDENWNLNGDFLLPLLPPSKCTCHFITLEAWK